MKNSVDTSKVFKELVHCFRCDECFYFTLWAIAKYPILACPQCGTSINLVDRTYQQLVVGVKERIAEISSFQFSQHIVNFDCVVSVSVAPLTSGSRYRPGVWMPPEPANTLSR
jgi:hypothetical protein